MRINAEKKSYKKYEDLQRNVVVKFSLITGNMKRSPKIPTHATYNNC